MKCFISKTLLIALLGIPLVSSTLVSCHQSLEVVGSSIESDTTDIPTPTIKVFIENSGSMDGYMCDGSELKDAVYDYIGSLDNYADTTELNYINTEIIPYKSTLKNFIEYLNPISIKRTGGNRNNSDIAEMLFSILDKTNTNTISIFVSDCILDIPNGSAIDFLTNRQIEIKRSFAKYLKKDKDGSVIICRMTSKFKGKFFTPHDTKLLDTMRPYYLWIIGNKYLLTHICNQVPLSMIKHGVEQSISYTSFSDIPFVITNKFGIINGLNNLERDGTYKFNILADFTPTLQSSDYIMQIENYDLINTSDIKLESIRTIKNKEKYSHIISLSTNKNLKSSTEYLRLRTLNIPKWVDMFNDDYGNSVNNNLNKTMGIKYIIGGVADAYKEINYCAGIKFKLNIK